MTTADKTGRQLIDSIRKAKSAAGDGPTSPAEAPEASAASSATTSTPRARRTAAPRRKATAEEQEKTSVTRAGSGFSRGRRVWPD